MADAHARLYAGRNGTVRASQYDGRVAGFGALLAAFPGRIAPHPHRDDAVLAVMGSGRRVRIEAGDWVMQSADGELLTSPDDQFRIDYHLVEAIAA